MSRKTLKVALLQETHRGTRDANLDAIEAGLREAASSGGAPHPLDHRPSGEAAQNLPLQPGRGEPGRDDPGYT